jgi:hypothetical protein
LNENDTFVGYTGTPTTSTIGTSYVTMSGTDPRIGTFSKNTPANQVLPALGLRDTDGSADSWGSFGFYWSSTPTGNTNGYYLYFGSGGVYPSRNLNAQYGYPIRCVK